MTILKPDVPGTVIRFIGERIPQILPAAAATVAVPFTHDWGPVFSDPPGTTGLDGGVQEVLNFEEFTKVYGDSDTDGRTAVAGAFAGQNLPGAAGAGAVITARMAGASAAKATITLNDRSVTPVASLRLDGKYVGSRGNRISYAIDTDPSNAARDRLRLLFDGAVQETYVYLQSDVVNLALAINRRSKLVTATNLQSTPSRLAANAGTALVGGDDGATLLAGDHLSVLAALTLTPFFGVLSPANLTSSAILASYVSWIQAQDQANYPVRMVVGGAAGESIDDAMTRTVACSDPHVVNLGVGTYHDDLLDKDLSTAQLAPRVAGILAAKGEKHALTFSKIGGLHVIGDTGPTPDAIEAAVTQGVTVLGPAASRDADLRIVKGVTTFTDPNDPVRPVEIFGDPRLIGVMDGYVRDMKTWGDDIVIGDLPVNDDTRDDVRAHAKGLQDDLLRQGLILPGDDVTIPKPWVSVENTDADPTLRDAIPYRFGWQFAFTTNAILGEGHVR